ncbi:MAG: hypothetical protein FWC71_05455 [Defluviitaleaceae bacterium]|nr:hypothetical protein [Defluviitaleaceae bacterium]
MMESYSFWNINEKVELMHKMIPAFINKSREWENEREWRMLWPDADFNKNPLFTPINNCVDLSSCVTKIILGFDCDNETSETVIDIAKRLNYSVSKIEVNREMNILKEHDVFVPKPLRPVGQARNLADANVFQKIKHLIAEHNDISENIIELHSRLADDLKVNPAIELNGCSFFYVEVVFNLEEEYNIEISTDDVDKWVTVQDIFNCVCKKMWR